MTARPSDALELRLRGATYREISTALDISLSVAHEYVARALKESRG